MCNYINNNNIMKHLLKLLKEKELKTDSCLMSLRIFSDGSCFLLSDVNKEIFEFDTCKELIKYLKNN